MADSGGKEERVLIEQKVHQRASFEWLSRALNLDEKGKLDDRQKKQAVLFYKRGIEELLKGVNVVVDGEGRQFERARLLQEKMQANLSHAQHRLSVLSEEVSQYDFKSPSSSTRPASSSLPQASSSLPQASSSSNSKLKITPKSTIVSSLPQSKAISKRPASSSAATATSSSARLRGIQETKKKAPLSDLKNVDKKLLDHILNEIIISSPSLTLNDIVGQEVAKQALHEIIVIPSLKPEWFTGLRTPPRGLLLFGPPGNGKTMLAQAVANECKWTFFNISAATLTSKWVGEGEKLVKALFAAAKHLSPSIIFIDELDSLLSERRDGEADSSRRIKTQFMIEFQTSETSERLLVIGATNRPYDLDEAVLRRFPKRIYLPMPSQTTRQLLLQQLLKTQSNNINYNDLLRVASLTQGYSASDLSNLAKDAAMAPIREISVKDIQRRPDQKIRDIRGQDLMDSLKRIRPSVAMTTIHQLEEWNQSYGDVTVT